MRKKDIKYIEHRLQEMFPKNKIKLYLYKDEYKTIQYVKLSIDFKNKLLLIDKKTCSLGFLIDYFREKIIEVLANGRN
jgi:hypothetical protein